MVCLPSELFLSDRSPGIFTYLVAFLLHTYGMAQGDAGLPLGIVGAGAVLGSLVGGNVAGRKQRLNWAALVLLLGGLSVSLAFSARLAPWTAIMLCCAGTFLLTIFEPVTWVLTAELAGEFACNGERLVGNRQPTRFY